MGKRGPMPGERVKREKRKERARGPGKIHRINWGLVSYLFKSGKTEQQICEILEINHDSLYKWKKRFPELANTIKDWKAEADQEIEMALRDRAKGYKHDSEEIHIIDKQVVRVPITKQYAPDPTSMIFWLKNRQPDKWRDKHEVAVDGPISVEIIQFSPSEDKDRA